MQQLLRNNDIRKQESFNYMKILKKLLVTFSILLPERNVERRSKIGTDKNMQ